MAAEMEAEIPAGGHIQQGPSPVEVHAQPCKLAAVEMAQAANAASAWYQPCAVRTACVAGPACCTCLQQVGRVKQRSKALLIQQILPRL
jgi:hypothetical protein